MVSVAMRKSCNIEFDLCREIILQAYLSGLCLKIHTNEFSLIGFVFVGRQLSTYHLAHT
jgi:hypothetical protein